VREVSEKSIPRTVPIVTVPIVTVPIVSFADLVAAFGPMGEGMRSGALLREDIAAAIRARSTR
jgi:hypothetical protein